MDDDGTDKFGAVVTDLSFGNAAAVVSVNRSVYGLTPKVWHRRDAGCNLLEADRVDQAMVEQGELDAIIITL